MIGVCGDNCFYCPRYVATTNGSTEELEEARKLWIRLGLRDPTFPVENMACFGCKPENNCAYSKVRTCAQTKGIENCGLCQEYPCNLIDAAFVKSESLSFRALQICTPTELDMLNKAFFSKRQNLDQIHLETNEEKTK
jgi:hypothetical protein